MGRIALSGASTRGCSSLTKAWASRISSSVRPSWVGCVSSVAVIGMPESGVDNAAGSKGFCSESKCYA